VRARLVGLVAAVGAALVLCAACQGMAGSTAPPAGQVTSGQVTSGQGDPNAELAQIESTLDSVSAGIQADSAP
jgi:hypothetical protein